MENVPELQRHAVFSEFINTLKSEGFHFNSDPKQIVIYCPDYGIPQERNRVVLLASRLGPIELMPPTHHPDRYLKVSDVLKSLPALESGEECAEDLLHRA